MRKCPHCGETFGYWVDNKFYPVAAHIHKMTDGGKIKFHADGRKENLK